MKRTIDFILALLLLGLLLPLLVIICCLQIVLLGKPVFFTQERAGYRARPFKIIKFRTMQPGSASDSDRLTLWGKLLRSTSVDELPELWNVLKGEMSLVGPRPLPTTYLDRYNSKQAKRHDVRPGITGWAQVSGRNSISWEQQFELDLWYVENHSRLLDLKILALTLVTVFKRENINESNQTTRTEFLG